MSIRFPKNARLAICCSASCRLSLGTDGSVDKDVATFIKFLIATDARLGEEVHSSGCSFQILNGYPSLVSVHLMIAALVDAVAIVVGEADRIEDQMVVNMSPVNNRW